jgi:hypothetical protein
MHPAVRFVDEKEPEHAGEASGYQDPLRQDHSPDPSKGNGYGRDSAQITASGQGRSGKGPRMTSQEFLDLSTRLCKDLKGWIAEAGKDDNLSAEYLAHLNSTIEIIDQVTLREVQKKPQP